MTVIGTNLVFDYGTPEAAREAMAAIKDGEERGLDVERRGVSDDDLRAMETDINVPADMAYRERNAIVAALIRTNGWPTQVVMAPDTEGWWIVYAETPAGQVSWHISPDDMDLFSDWPIAFGSHHSPWDGHTTDEKYRRLALLARLAAPPDVELAREAADSMRVSVDDIKAALVNLRGPVTRDESIVMACAQAVVWAMESRAALAKTEAALSPGAAHEERGLPTAIVRDLIYGLRHQPEVSRVDIASIMERYLVATPEAAPEEGRTVWTVQYSNYEPAEVDSTWATQADAEAEAERLNGQPGSTGMWQVGSFTVRAPTPAPTTEEPER